jgi:multicomponent K+:H+ antiporter subunit D
VERSRTGATAASTPFDDEADASPVYVASLDPRGELAMSDEAPVGRAIPGTMAFLGLSFTACALLVAGLPPLSGFLAKFAMLAAVLDVSSPTMTAAGWTFFTFAIVSGLAATVVLSRAGIRYFWAPQGRGLPTVRWVEGLPVGALLLVALALTVFAQPVTLYTRAAAAALFSPSPYVEAILSAKPVPSPGKDRGAADR